MANSRRAQKQWSFDKKRQLIPSGTYLTRYPLTPVLYRTYHMTEKMDKDVENQPKSIFPGRRLPGPRKETTDGTTEIYNVGSYARSNSQLLPDDIL